MARSELTTADSSPVIPEKATGWAWAICWLMFASTVLNYMDRQSMALVGPQVRQEFRLSSEDFGWVLAAFQLSYALFQVPAGYLVDRWNVRTAYAGAVVWWSLAGMSAAFAPSLAILMVLRALLGVGESFNWPCALRATARILPPADRSLGNGIFNSGAAIGAVITPLVVPLLTARYGWRKAFVVVGALGLVWVLAWLGLLGGERKRLFAGRASAQPLSSDELGHVPARLSSLARAAFGGVVAASVLVGASAVWVGMPAIWWAIAVLMAGLLVAAVVLPPHALKGADWAESLGEIVRLRRFWILVLVTITINVSWHFLVNWLPSFLKEDRELSGLVGVLRRLSETFGFRADLKYLASGLLSAVPFLAADIGNLGGGAVARYFAGRGFTAVAARKIVIALCTLFITCGTLVGFQRNDTMVVVLICVMAMATAAFMANYFAFAQEVAARHTGLVVGILGGLGNLFAGGFLVVAGKIKDVTGSFALPFLIVGLLPYLGAAALLLGWGSRPEESKAA